MCRKEKNKYVRLGSGKSPAELLFVRNLRTNLQRLVNEKTSEEFRKKDKELKECQKEYINKRRRAQRRTRLAKGDQVWVRTVENKEGSRGTIEEKAKEPESYLVRIGNKIYWRTRKNLRKLNVEPETSSSQNTRQEDLDK